MGYDRYHQEIWMSACFTEIKETWHETEGRQWEWEIPTTEQIRASEDKS